MVEPQLITELNTILESHGSASRFELTDPIVSVHGLVTDTLVQDRPISRFLTGLVCEPIHDGLFYHYTSGAAAQSICASKLLRLTSVLKRITDEEIKEFLERFDFAYPLQSDPHSGYPNFHSSIAPRLFYTSFTEIGLSAKAEEYFWKTFASDNGARLKFRVHLGSGLLRRISYGDDLDRALRAFAEIKMLVTRFGYKGFFWDDVGTVCALHLPVDYQHEKEIRLIAKKTFGLRSGSDCGHEYLELPFGSNSQLQLDIELIEVQTNRSDLGGFGVHIIPRH